YDATLRRPRKALIQDQQVRVMAGLLLVTGLVIIARTAGTPKLPSVDALRIPAVSLTSVATTTCFALVDYRMTGAVPLTLV
ncbi:potassium transporter TrkH, partial [Pseudomonas aeruginosa]